MKGIGVTQSAAGSNAFPILQPLISKPYVSYSTTNGRRPMGYGRQGNAGAIVT